MCNPLDARVLTCIENRNWCLGEYCANKRICDLCFLRTFHFRMPQKWGHHASIQEFLQGCTSFQELQKRTKPWPKTLVTLFACLLRHTTKFMEDPKNEKWNQISCFLLGLPFPNPVPAQVGRVVDYWFEQWVLFHLLWTKIYHHHHHL